MYGLISMGSSSTSATFSNWSGVNIWIIWASKQIIYAYVKSIFFRIILIQFRDEATNTYVLGWKMFAAVPISILPFRRKGKHSIFSVGLLKRGYFFIDYNLCYSITMMFLLCHHFDFNENLNKTAYWHHYIMAQFLLW